MPCAMWIAWYETYVPRGDACALSLEKWSLCITTLTSVLMRLHYTADSSVAFIHNPQRPEAKHKHDTDSGRHRSNRFTGSELFH